MGRKLKNNHSPTIYFQLFDETKWEMIDKLMTIPKYARSRTALILRALDFGLPLVMDEEFCMPVADKGLNEYIPAEPDDDVKSNTLKEIVYLLHDIDMNTTITKSLACSLFNERCKSLNGTQVDGERFTKGGLRATPDYMEGYELAQLKMIKESSKR
jgi:hypothetical protein